MTTFVNEIDAYIEEHLDDFVAEMIRLCRQPSVSAQNLGLEETARLVARMLEERGFHTETLPTDGAPVVYGEAPGRADRTLLFYNHYDVQPPEPLELWDSPPFEPTLREGKLYARGVADDKGHIVSRLAALEAVRAVTGHLPCNVKFVIEGEEEIGSIHLPDVVKRERERLSADACIWEAGGVNYHDQLEIYLGMRGICYVDMRVRTAARDAHSGLGGSIFPNAAWRLTWALASLKGPDERVRIPGFYDHVVPPSPRDLEMLDALPSEEEELKETFGLKGFLRGLTGLELKRAAVFEPTCTICGLDAGYQGPGSKTVLPAEARAKVDFRLVPDQDPDDVFRKLRAYLDQQGFDDVEIELLGGEHPARVDPDHPFVRLVAETTEEVYGKPPAIAPIIGGSGPMYPFVAYLGLPIANVGIGYPDSRAHAPNENIRLSDFVRGTRHLARILTRFAEP